MTAGASRTSIWGLILESDALKLSYLYRPPTLIYPHIS
jgi:hypothetical protein